ncbi:MAG TPA: hypothetical protein VKT29_02085 [Terriglobales bacterium]|nr:hypothetical protein [Terriglobales bacterium]
MTSRVRMPRLQTVLAWVLIFAIVVIVIAPSVDLDPAAMRAQQAAMMAMAALAAAGVALATLLLPISLSVVPATQAPAAASLHCLLDLICSRLC